MCQPLRFPWETKGSNQGLGVLKNHINTFVLENHLFHSDQVLAANLPVQL